MAINIASLKVKSNARWVCQECGSTEFIQGHHQMPKDDSTIIALCADCHSKKHPNVPRGLFFVKNHQPYWENISASSLAQSIGVHPRTVIRVVRKLDIAKGFLSDANRKRICSRVRAIYLISVDKNSIIQNSYGLKVFRCMRCNWEWAGRRGKPDKPMTCPKCRSPYWDKEKQSERDYRTSP